MWAYLLVHLVCGAVVGGAAQYLIAAGRTGVFSPANWIVLCCFFAAVYWFSDYVGAHVRNQTFGSDVQGLSVLFMTVAFLLGYIARAHLVAKRRQ